MGGGAGGSRYAGRLKKDGGAWCFRRWSVFKEALDGKEVGHD